MPLTSAVCCSTTPLLLLPPQPSSTTTLHDHPATTMALTSSAARYITGHDASGKSIFLYEGEVPTFTTGLNMSTHGLAWSAGSPPDLADDTDTQLSTSSLIHTGAGSTARFLVVPPGNKAVMHRTATIDYGEFESRAPCCAVQQG